MGRFGRMIGRVLAPVLGLSVMVSSCASAAPLDELAEILDRQAQMQEESLLSQQLGLSELEEAIDGNGVQMQIRGGLTEKTAASLDMEGMIPEDGYASLNMQVNPKLKKWLFDGSVGMGEEPYAALFLYGDQEQLAVMIPQLYAGALAVRAGNFREQYQNSALGQLLGDTEEAPDMEMKFYLDGNEGSEEPVMSDFEEEMAYQAEQLQDGLIVEKTETADETVYTAAMKAEDIVDFYEIILKEYGDSFRNSGLMTEDEADSYERECALMLDQMEAMIGEKVEVNFHVQDGLVTKIDYEVELDSREAQKVLDAAAESESDSVQLNMADTPETVSENASVDTVEPVTENASVDTVEPVTESASVDTVEPVTESAALDIVESVTESAAVDTEKPVTENAAEQTETTLTSVEEGALEEAGIVSIDAEFEDTGFVGTAYYEMECRDPRDVAKGVELGMIMKEENGNEAFAFRMVKETSDTDSGELTTVSLEMRENGEVLYSGTPFHMEYDTADGSLNMEFEMPDDTTGEIIGFYLDSTISRTEDVPGFVWNISRLAVGAGEGEVGVTAEVTVKADPGVIETPQNLRVLFEMDTEALIGLLTEIEINAERLEQGQTADTVQSEAQSPEEKTDTGSEAVTEAEELQTQKEDSDDIDDGIGVQADGSNVIIGGADGPTSIFLAGKLG